MSSKGLQMKLMNVRGFRVVAICLAISFGGIVSGFIGTQTVLAVTKSRFEKLELFNKVLYLIESHYYREVDTDKLIQGAIRGMMDTLDPHTTFLDEELFARMQEDTSGEFGGLGLEVTQKDGIIIVITPVEDSPAFKAGIRPADKIVEINHDSVIGMGLNKAVDMMKGKAGTSINLGVVREGQQGVIYFDVTRQMIKKNAVKAAIVRDEFIHIRLTQFMKDVGDQIAGKLVELEKEIHKKKGELKGIVLDLRSNPGGLLDEAVSVSSIFLKNGVVVSTEGRDKNQKDIRYVKKTGHKELTVPLVVLVNGSSASASEIVAGALQDQQRAIIMGVQTFGKGSVQTISKIDDKTGVKLTIAQYMTPKGRKIQAIGIKPDVIIEEVEGDWVNGHISPSSIIREKDLRNHLTATIETEEEKQMRLEEEKEDRAARIASYQQKLADSKKKNAVMADEDPNKDYLVHQAINYINSFDVFKKLKDL